MALDDNLATDLGGATVEPVNGNGSHSSLEVEEIATRVAQQAAAQATQQVIDSLPKGKKGNVGRVSQPVSQLAKMFPASAEKVVVRVRRLGDAPGTSTYVGAFNALDVQGYLNIEEFLRAALVPQWGYGDYKVSLAAANGVETRTELYGMHPPVGGNNGNNNGLFGSLKDLVNMPNYGLPQSPVSGDPLAAAPNTVNTVNDGRLDRIERLLERQGQGPDPRDVLIKKLVDKLDDVDRKINTAQPAPTAPPVDVASIVMQVAAAMKPAAPAPDNSLEKLLLLVDRLVPKEQPKQTDPWDMLTKIGTIKKELFGDLAEQQKDLNRKLEAYMNQAPPDPIEEVERVQKMHQMIKSMVSSESDSGSFGSYIGQIFKGLPQVLDKARGIVDAQARIPPKTVIVQQQAQPQAKAAVDPNAVPYPEGFEPYLTSVQSSNGAREYIESTLKAFEFLGKDPNWGKFYHAAYTLASKGDKKAIKYIDALLKHFEARGEIHETRKTAILSAITEHWDTILSVAFNYVKPVVNANISVNNSVENKGT